MIELILAHPKLGCTSGCMLCFQIWLDDVRCTASHETLLDCFHSAFGTHNCGHSEDVFVECGT